MAQLAEIALQFTGMTAEQAREAAAADHARMLAELKHHIGQLVVQTTAAITGKVLTPEDQRRLAEETAREVAK